MAAGLAAKEWKQVELKKTSSSDRIRLHQSLYNVNKQRKWKQVLQLIVQPSEDWLCVIGQLLYERPETEPEPEVKFSPSGSLYPR